MKRIGSIVMGSCFAVVIACGGCAPKLKAQADHAEIFNVPFAFTADGYQVAAGTYEVHLLSDPHLISIRNIESGDKKIFSVRPEQQRKISSKGTLVFHRCGAREDLTEFHIPGTNLYSATISLRGKSSKLERCPAADTMTVAAR